MTLNKYILFRVIIRKKRIKKFKNLIRQFVLRKKKINERSKAKNILTLVADKKLRKKKSKQTATKKAYIYALATCKGQRAFFKYSCG